MVAEEREPFQILFYRAALNQRSRKSIEQMTMAKTITIETHRQIWIRSHRKTSVAWCGACRAETLMLMPEQAAILYRTTQREIFRQIESGKLHFIEAIEGAVLVCCNSLDNQTISILKPREANYGEQDSTD
jgi:hypothetical protein